MANTKKAASKTTTTKAKKKAPAKKTSKEVTVDRRANSDRRQKDELVEVDRRKSPRRRQIDPTTCERDYTNDEIEFMQHMDDYKRRSGRMFPTCSEILEVMRDMGYRRLNDEQLAEFEGDTIQISADALDADSNKEEEL